MSQITKEMTIEEIFATFPQKSQKLAQVMQSFGLQCVGCQASTWETLEMGVLGHGHDEETLEKILSSLNQVLEEKIDATTISITARAAEKYKAILASENKEGYGIRFSEKAGGCSGFEYTLDYSEKPQEGDVTFSSNGIDIHIKEGSVERLLGSEIDYTDGLHGAGFKITNPNVKSSCSCGTSHSY